MKREEKEGNLEYKHDNRNGIGSRRSNGSDRAMGGVAAAVADEICRRDG